MGSEVLKNMNVLYQKDPFVENLSGGIWAEIWRAKEQLADVAAQDWLDTVTWDLEIIESALGIPSDTSKSIPDRRSAVSAKWLSGGKVDVQLMQAVANAWKNGEASVAFKAGSIQLTFNGIYGVPSDLLGLEAALDEVKPAHLPLLFLYNYLLVRDVESMTIRNLETMTMDKFAF